MKLAAAEGLENGGQGAPFSIVPGVEVPHVLSLLATHDWNGYVAGIEDIKAEYLEGLTFHYISEMSEALPLAFDD